jgi:SepF-like predicted cell division protein (DUF552 family)
MSDFDLDLRTAEEHLDSDDLDGEIVLGVLDGSTDASEWIDEITAGHALVLSVEGDLNELAAGFAREVKEMDGQLMHFRKFLIVTPPGIDIDTDRLNR